MYQLLKSLFGQRARTYRRAPSVRFRPRLEILETRQLLSTFTVVLASDSGGSGGQEVTATSGDLRYCINQANLQPAGTTDTITFDPTLFATPQTITLNSANGTLKLSDPNSLTIQGPSGNTVTLSGGGAVGVLEIDSGNVTISNLDITQGFTTDKGGGILNDATLTLSHCELDHDTAGYGGGLDNLGKATVKGCVFNNDSTNGNGGGIFNYGQLTATNTTIDNCVSTGTGGAGLAAWPNSTTMLNHCTLSNDVSGDDGGGVFVASSPDSSATMTLTSCTLTNDSAGNGGGGLCTDGTLTAKMTTCNISDDTAGQTGGGVCNTASTIVLTNCTLNNDSVPTSGGGGLTNQGTAKLTGCTFSNDSAASGGGMFNEDPADLINCTFSDNHQTVNANFGGGGIYNAGGFTLTLTNCTVANNSAVGYGGGIWNYVGSTLNLVNTIVAENTAGSGGPDVYGTVNTADHNLIGDGSGMTITTDQGGNLIGGNGNPVIDPRLGPLQNNGGATQTMALLADSPAIGHADNAKAPTFDQRGHKRIDTSGEVTDIGAYEAP